MPANSRWELIQRLKS